MPPRLSSRSQDCSAPSSPPGHRGRWRQAAPSTGGPLAARVRRQLRARTARRRRRSSGSSSTTEGSYTGTIRWFRNPISNVSTHFVIRSSDGQVTQMLAEKDIGIHAGNSYYNATTVAIEHEAFVRSCTWYTDAMYRSSARLVAYLVLKYGIPLDRAHVIGHNEVPDPEQPWPARRRQRPLGSRPVLELEQVHGARARVRRPFGRGRRRRPHARPVQRPGWRLDAKSPQRYGRSYKFTRPSPTGAPATFRVRVPANGSYAVYGWWPAYRNRNSAVPVWIASAAGPTSVTVDQRRFGRRWVYLGTFALNKGLRSVQFSRRTSTTGVITADAVKLEPVRTRAASRLGPSSTRWALTPRQLSTTRDDGASWNSITPSDAPATTIRAVDFADAGRAASSSCRAARRRA